MIRQRLKTRTSPLSYLGRGLVLLLALALIWGGITLILLTLKVSPSTANAITGYRSFHDLLTSIDLSNLSNQTRVLIAAGGIACFLLCGLLAWKEIPRPYLARHDFSIEDNRQGTATVEPRAVERIAEVAALQHPFVSHAMSRSGTNSLEIEIELARATGVVQALTEVQERVRLGLSRHGLPELTTNVTLTGFNRQRKRELK